MILLSHTHTKKGITLILYPEYPALFVEQSYIKLLSTNGGGHLWIYEKLLSSHQVNFWEFLICFSFVDSELFPAFCFGHSVYSNRFSHFYN